MSAQAVSMRSMKIQYTGEKVSAQRSTENNVVIELSNSDNSKLNFDQFESKVNTKAKTSYNGHSVPITLENEKLSANNQIPSNFVGILEFDMYGKQTDKASARTSDGWLTTCNRVSADTRKKFEDLMEGNIKLEECSDAEILALNHLAGNAYRDANGNWFRQPTEEEVVNEKQGQWLPVSENEAALRNKAFEILTTNTEKKDPLPTLTPYYTGATTTTIGTTTSTTQLTANSTTTSSESESKNVPNNQNSDSAEESESSEEIKTKVETFCEENAAAISQFGTEEEVKDYCKDWRLSEEETKSVVKYWNDNHNSDNDTTK